MRTHALHPRRTARTQRHALERELALYATPAEQLDLDAAIRRADPADAETLLGALDRVHARRFARLSADH